MKRPANRKSAYHHGDLTEALIAGAEKLLRREGVDGCSLRAVAREIGVSQAAPYHHFKSKEDLLDAVVARGFDRLAHQQEAAMDGATDAHGKLRANGVAYVAFAVREPALFHLMFGRDYSRASFQARYRAIADRSFGLFADACQAALQPRSPIEAMEFQLSAWSLAHGLASLMVEQRVGELARGILSVKPAAHLGGADVERLAATVLDALLTPAVSRQ
jgi:AcrR family transcriptional regulator